MIRVTVELISAIHPSRNRLLGIATIATGGTGEEKGKRASYLYVLSKAGTASKLTWQS